MIERPFTLMTARCLVGDRSCCFNAQPGVRLCPCPFLSAHRPLCARTPCPPQLFPAGLNAPRLEEVRFSEVAGPVGDAVLGLLTNCPNLRSLAVSGPQCLTGEQQLLRVVCGSGCD